MKKAFLLICILLISNACASRLRCCVEREDVSELLTGYWKEKNSKSTSLFMYSFNQHQAHYTEVEPTAHEGEYFIIDDHTFVDIIKNGQGFDLHFTDLSGSLISKIKFLDQQKLILEMDGIATEFIKVAE